MKRFAYQVAVASLSGFKSTAIPFAQTHRIPLISFSESVLFENIRNAILEVERRAVEDENFEKLVLQYLKKHQYDKYLDNVDCQIDEIFTSFIGEISWFQEKIVIGLLEDGTIIFMIKEKQDNLYQNRKGRYNDGCEIYWSDKNEAWELYDGEYQYSFELPQEIYQEWIESAEEQRRAALQIKEKFFSKVVLFENGLRESIRTIYLLDRFIETARRNLDMK